MSIAVIAFMVFIERAQRRITIQYPKRQQQGAGGSVASSSHLPLKINTAGVIPPIFASSLLLLPITFVSFNAGSGPEWLNTISQFLSRGHPIYLSLYTAMIVFFAFFYTAIVFNPKDTADNLKKYGGFVPGIRPGAETGDFLDKVMSLITFPGAIFLAILAVLPAVVVKLMDVQAGWALFYGGTSLLIMVGVAIDTVQQVNAYLLNRHYDGLMKSGKNRKVA